MEINWTTCDKCNPEGIIRNSDGTIHSGVFEGPRDAAYQAGWWLTDNQKDECPDCQ